ncbi:hypothetical protein FRC02_003200, partial [Tulasnella sp. 418]
MDHEEETMENHVLLLFRWDVSGFFHLSSIMSLYSILVIFGQHCDLGIIGHPRPFLIASLITSFIPSFASQDNNWRNKKPPSKESLFIAPSLRHGYFVCILHMYFPVIV